MADTVNVVHTNTVIVSRENQKGTLKDTDTANLGRVVVLSNVVKGQISKPSHNKVQQVDRG